MAVSSSENCAAILEGLAQVPSALDRLPDIIRRIAHRRVAVFLDYDGTLTPIVDRPELAVMSEEMRATLAGLARVCTVAIVSGRDRADVERLVGLDSLLYAGSHGFDIAGPGGRRMQHAEGTASVPALRRAEDELRRGLGAIPGTIVEGKRYAVAVHYRLVRSDQIDAVERTVEAVAASHPKLRKTGGKKVFELRPRLDWDKGKAVLWLLQAFGLDAPDALSVYLGDDLTDEDAFDAVRDRGAGVLIATEPRPTRARYRLRDPGEVRAFLERLTGALREKGG